MANSEQRHFSLNAIIAALLAVIYLLARPGTENSHTPILLRESIHSILFSIALLAFILGISISSLRRKARHGTLVAIVCLAWSSVMLVAWIFTMLTSKEIP